MLARRRPQRVADAGSELSEAVDEAATVRDARLRVQTRIAAPDRRSGLVTGGSFTVAMVTWLALAPPQTLPLGVLLACIAAHAVASSVEFEIGPGSALPTTPVLIVSLFLLPPQLVPLVAVGGLLVAALVARLHDPGRRERLLVLVGSGWHATGPALVFALARISRPDVADWAVYVLALGAQFAFDAGSSWVRNCYGLGVPTRRLVGALRFTFLADLLLAPIGLAAALALPGSPAALLFLVPPTLLLAMLQLDRKRQISRAVTLGEAVHEASDRARHDVLTGLLNRLAWEEALARYADTQTPVAIVLADVDGLKAANDSFGHDAGDELLVRVAVLIAQSVPAGDGAVVARLGGDEFGVLLPGDLAGGLERVAGNLRAAFATTGPIHGVVPVSASIGVAVAANGAGLPRAMAEADHDVYEQKKRAGVRRR